MQLRPRCADCRQTGHLVCPTIVVPVVNAVLPAVVVRQPKPKCCSFCSKPGHYKPRCEKYKLFVEEVGSSDDGTFLKNMQKLFCRFLRFRYTPRQISGIFNLEGINFGVIVDLFLQLFEPQHHAYEPQYETPQPKQSSKIVLELCENNSMVHQECGICLSDEIPCCNMVKFGCGHEFCDGCAEKVINTKPCCALCRADVKKVCVNSTIVFDNFKKNKQIKTSK